MTNSMISIRIPVSLVDELKDSAKKDHYMDLSEAVRSVIRNRWLKGQDPVSYEIKKLKEEITKNLTKKKEQAVLDELRKIRDTIIKDE